MKRLVLLLVVVFAVARLSAQLAFEAVNTLPVLPTYFNGVAFGDLDGDGDNDVIITGEYVSQFGGDTTTVFDIAEMYLNDGTGTFTLVEGTPFPPSSDGDIELADVDNDGDLDVFLTGIVNYETYVSKLYLNDGSANFTEVTDAPFLPLASAGFSKFIDVNGDGALDLFVCGQTGGEELDDYQNTRLYINDGNGNFTEKPNEGIMEINYCSFDFGDIDNDGDPDLLIGGMYLADDWWPEWDGGGYYENDGEGNFTLKPSDLFQVFTGNETSIRFADFDEDGDLDVFTTGMDILQDIWNATIYYNDGNGNFPVVDTTSIPCLMDGAVDIGDADGDGDLDILMVGYGDGEEASTIATIYTNDGNGNFEDGLNPYYFLWQYEGIAKFVDINNDTLPDVYIAGLEKSGPGQGFLVSQLYKNVSTPASVNENENTSVLLFPNPTKGEFDIKSQEPLTMVEIHSVDGRLVQKAETNKYAQRVDLRDEADGVYFVSIHTNNKVITKKVMKNNR